MHYAPLMKRRTIFTILAIIVILFLIAGGYYLYWFYSDKLPSGKKTKPDTIEVPEHLWPQYRLRVQHDGRAHPNASLKGTLQELWTTYDINEEYYSASKSSPAVDRDLVFIGADTGKLHAFWRNNGTEVWWFQTRPSGNGIHGTPAFDNEKVYIGAYDGWMYALYKLNGTLVWENELGDYIGSSSCLYNGVAYIGVEMSKPAGYLVGCNMTTGAEVFRSKEFDSHPHSTPSVDPERGYIYIGANDGRVYCYNISSQEEVWSFKTEKEIKSTPCIANDILYITSWDNKLYVLDLETGEEYFHYETGMRSMSSAAIDSSGTRVFFGSHDRNIYCINARSGVMNWRYKTGARILSSPTILDNDKTVVCGSNDGNVYILGMATGEKKGKIDFGIEITSVPVVVQNQLYVFDNEGILHRFDAN